MTIYRPTAFRVRHQGRPWTPRTPLDLRPCSSLPFYSISLIHFTQSQPTLSSHFIQTPPPPLSFYSPGVSHWRQWMLIILGVYRLPCHRWNLQLSRVTGTASFASFSFFRLHATPFSFHTLIDLYGCFRCDKMNENFTYISPSAILAPSQALCSGRPSSANPHNPRGSPLDKSTPRYIR